MQRIAIIDMGTNTFHLLVADLYPSGQWKIIHRDLEAVKIGLSGINEGLITESAFQRALQATARFAKSLARLNVNATYAFGTSAFRNARNAPQLISEIKIKTGVDVQVIDGDREAELIFAGASAAVAMDWQSHLVMDIGAGSVEFIIGNCEKIFWKRSFEIGGQRLLEKFQKHDPILPEEILALDAYFEESLHPLWDACEKAHPETLIGSSGTFDTLSDIWCFQRQRFPDPEASERPLSVDGFFHIYDQLIRKNREDRMRIPGMIELRVDMIVVTSCLIRFILEKHPFKKIRVSAWSLKEGALTALLNG